MKTWIRKAPKEAQQIIDIEKNGVTYLKFPLLEETGVVTHGFTTREGGVSTGHLGTMNLSFTRGDEPENVIKNYELAADAIGFDPHKIICSDQTHTTNVRRVDSSECGKGVYRPKDYTDVDGMITNDPYVVLATSFADCVPLYFVDPVHKAIGLSHSGWKGTSGKIGLCTVKAMTREFGTRPEDIYAAIGPSICQDCYEVSEDVILAFSKIYSSEVMDKICYGKGGGKYQLDLWKANYEVFLEAGILPEHIAVTDICTCCNPTRLFSHRASHGLRGNLAAFLALKQ